MKQKDLAMIVLVVAISTVVAYFVSKALFGGSSKHQLKAPVVQAITADFPLPDERFFNAQSLNPTQTITIGDGANQNPFNGQ